MRTLLFILLTLPLTAFSADDDFDKKLEELQAGKGGLKEQLEAAREKHKFEKFPNDDYIKAYNEIIATHVKKELQLHKEFCKSEGDKACLTDKQVEEKKNQFAVAATLQNRKNEWAKEKVSEEDMDKRIEAYSNCHEKKEGCDKLPEADRKIAAIEVSEESESTTETKTEERRELKRIVRKRDAQQSMSLAGSTSGVTSGAGSTSGVTSGAGSTSGAGVGEVLIDVSVAAADDKTEPVVAKKDDKKEEPKKEDKKEEPKKEDKKEDKKEAAASDEVIEVSDDEKTPRNYKPETCRWVNDLPRKVVNGPGCGPKNRSMICTGYVICEQKQGGAKFIRMSTCAADKCGASDEDAVRCTKDMGYYSMKPKGEAKLFMSPELKKILSNGASRQ